MRRVKSFWRKDTKTNLKYNSKNNHHHHNKNVQIFNTCLDPNNPIVPNIVIQTIAYIEQYAINEIGLFRVFGNQTDVNSLKLAFEKYETIDLSKISNPHIVTSVLKLYLRELPEPLFTFNSYEALIVSHGISDTDMRLTVIKSIIQKIVPHHLVVLEYIFAFLCRVVINSKNNHMDSSNLAIIFAPTLLKSKSETAEKLIADSPRSTSIIKIIIDNYSEIFEKDSITGDHVSPAKSTTPFFEQDYLLSIKYETINLDKEIAEILKEEEDLANRSLSLDNGNNHHGELTSSSVSACGGNVNSRLHSSNRSNNSRPSVFQVFDNNSVTSTGGIVSYNGSRLSIISNDSSASSPDMSEFDDGEEEEELKKPPGSTVISPSIIPQGGHYEEEIDDDDDEDNGNGGNNEIEFKIQVIKELIDKTILELQNEFIQLEKDLQDSLSFQEILLVASSLKSIMQILIEGPDVDSQVVSFDENISLPDADDVDQEQQQQQIKRLEILKKAILLKINSSIPSLLLELKDESYSLTIQKDIGKDICLVDLITIMRTLRSVNDVLDFFFSKWSIIESSSPSSPNNKKHHHHQSSPINSSPKLSSSPQSNSPPINKLSNNDTTTTRTTTNNTTTTTTNTINTTTTATPNNSSIISNNNGGMFNEKEEFIISIQPNEQDIVSNICDIDMVLFEAEETLMGISSKSELIYIAKVVQNLQKVVRTPIKISLGSFDEIEPPKINTLKITPKHKLAPLVSVVYVLIKEIRDQISLLRTGFQNSTSSQKQQLVNHYCSRLLDIWRVLSKLPAFNSYKTSYRNRQEISLKNCQHMRETIESTLWKLVPLFSQLKLDVLEKHDISCDNLIVISKSVTKIKKIFEDSQISSRTSIKFSPFQTAKSNPINLSNDNFNLNGSGNNNSINDKITTLKNLTASIVDQVISRFSQIEKHFNEINQENYLYEITDILKLVITNFKDIKLLNI